MGNSYLTKVEMAVTTTSLTALLRELMGTFLDGGGEYEAIHDENFLVVPPRYR